MIKEPYRNVFIGIILIIIGIILDFAIQLAGTLANEVSASLLHVSRNQWLPITVMCLTIAILLVVTVIILVYAIRKQAPKLGIHPIRAEKLTWVFKGYGLILLSGMVTNLLQMAIMGNRETANNQQALEDMANAGGASLLFVVVLAVVVAPIVEELIFRGVILNYFFKQGSWWLNVVISGLLFGYFHVYQDFQIFALLQYSLMGLSLAVVYKKTKQIQYAMLTHMLNNSIAAVVLVTMALQH